MNMQTLTPKTNSRQTKASECALKLHHPEVIIQFKSYFALSNMTHEVLAHNEYFCSQLAEITVRLVNIWSDELLVTHIKKQHGEGVKPHVFSGNYNTSRYALIISS